VTGNTVIDALLMVVKRTMFNHKVLDAVLEGAKPVVLVTAHRRETGESP